MLSWSRRAFILSLSKIFAIILKQVLPNIEFYQKQNCMVTIFLVTIEIRHLGSSSEKYEKERLVFDEMRDFRELSSYQTYEV